VIPSFAHLKQLRTEHSRISTLLASLESGSPLNRRRIGLLGKILAGLESAIWFEEARDAEGR
jgi:hypothetical protein